MQAANYRKSVASAGQAKKRTASKIEPSAEIKQEIKEAFDLFDTDGTGVIDVKELKVDALSCVTIYVYLVKLNNHVAFNFTV